MLTENLKLEVGSFDTMIPISHATGCQKPDPYSLS
jgi:hypothetical protein